MAIERLPDQLRPDELALCIIVELFAGVDDPSLALPLQKVIDYFARHERALRVWRIVTERDVHKSKQLEDIFTWLAASERQLIFFDGTVIATTVKGRDRVAEIKRARCPALPPKQ